MKRIVLLLILTAASSFLSAQSRRITRGAEEGELYMSTVWYVNYYETDYAAILHITENGKKVEITHGIEVRPPDAGIADSLPMQILYVIADATPGVLYNVDWCYDKQVYQHTRLWFSDDYGKSWELRDKNDGRKYYRSANVEGLVYRTSGEGNYIGTYKSYDYAEFFTLIDDKKINADECGFEECEFFTLVGRGFYHTYDCFQNYINLSIDEQFVYGQMGGFFPDVFRGGLSGEVYVTSGFPSNIYKVSFSADNGYNFRVVHLREGYATFMSDRKAGDFYIVTQQTIETQQPWGWYTYLCIEHYSNYGETLAGTYCHNLTRNYLQNCAGVLDLEAKTQDNNNVTLQWNPPQAEYPVIAYRLYRNDVLLAELQQTSFLDENMSDGNYTYHVRTVYADGCESLSYNIAKITVQVTGVEEIDLSNIYVYPNPTGGELTITNYELRITGVEVFDLMGRKILSQKAEVRKQKELDISHLPAGMYFVQIQTEERVITKKVVKR